MWKNKPEIKEYVENSNGFCLEHFSMLLQKGEKLLSETEYFEFCKMILPIQEKNFKRLEEEIQWFINKFDYKYKDEPWKTSKDALLRGVTKITSTFLEEEKND